MLAKPYPGQQVRLKSGGPVMTVGSVIFDHDNQWLVKCSWFYNMTMMREYFFASQLDVVE